MKTLIIYATKKGSTKKVAEIIANKINGAGLHDINSGGAVSLKDYDCVILGSFLTAGFVNKEIKNFALKYNTDLQNKKLGIFLSGLDANGEEGYLKKNFPEDLLNKAEAKAFLGGIFDPEKCGFLARKIIKTVSGQASYTSTIDEEKIESFVQALLK